MQYVFFKKGIIYAGYKGSWEFLRICVLIVTYRKNVLLAPPTPNNFVGRATATASSPVPAPMQILR